MAVDTWGEALETLKKRVAAEGLGAKVRTLQADFADLPAIGVHDDSADLIWSEGAIYNLGWPRGLEEWGRALRPGVGS